MSHTEPKVQCVFVVWVTVEAFIVRVNWVRDGAGKSGLYVQYARLCTVNVHFCFVINTKDKVTMSSESNSYRTMYPFFPIQPQRLELLRNLCPAVAGRWVGCCRESWPSGSIWERPRRSCQSRRFYGSVGDRTKRNRNHKEFHIQIKFKRKIIEKNKWRLIIIIKKKLQKKWKFFKTPPKNVPVGLSQHIFELWMNFSLDDTKCLFG